MSGGERERDGAVLMIARGREDGARAPVEEEAKTREGCR